jgi:hypothetical protein
MTPNSAVIGILFGYLPSGFAARLAFGVFGSPWRLSRTVAAARAYSPLFLQTSGPTLSADENEQAPANQADASKLAHAGTEWKQLLDQHQKRQSCDPKQIHEAAHEQEPH